MARLKNFWRLVNFGHFFGYSPYFYSKKDGAVLFNPSRSIYKRMVTSFWMVVIYEMFIVFRTVQVFMSEEISAAGKMQNMSVTVFYILLNFNHIITLRNYGEHHICINTFLKITSLIKENAGSSSGRSRGLDKKSKKMERFQSTFCAVAGMFLVLVSLARALKVFANPDSREMLTSVASNPKMLKIWIKIPLSLLHGYLALFHGYSIALHGSTFCCFSTAMVTTIHQTQTRYNANGGEKITTKKQMLTIQKDYIQLSVLQSFVTSIYGIWPLGFEITLLFHSTIHIFLGVVFQNIGYGMKGLVSALLLLSLFSNFAELNSLSIEFLHSWKVGLRRSSWFAKFHLCCQPLKLSIGNFFYADRTLVLTIISVIINNATSLIISYKDKHTD